jgi:hypothetical protein
MADGVRHDHPDVPAGGPSPGPVHYHQTLLGRLDQRYLSRPPAMIGLAVLFAAVLIVPSVQFVIRIGEIEASPLRAGGWRHRTALGRWLLDAEALTKIDQGEDPYGYGHWFPAPPLVLMGLVPLSKMGYTAAGVLWAVLKVGGFVAAMGLLIRSHRSSGHAVPVGVLLMTAVFGMRPIVSDLQHGNLNIFMMVWLALTWWAYVQGRDFWTGFLVALAIVTKLTPALLLVYFVYKKSRLLCLAGIGWGLLLATLTAQQAVWPGWVIQALLVTGAVLSVAIVYLIYTRARWLGLGAATGLFLFFILLPGAYLGYDRNFELLRAWFDMLVAPFALDGYAVLHPTNQSLYGVALRLLSNAGIIAVEHTSTGQMLTTGMDTLARPVTFLGSLLRPAISLGVVGSLAWLCRCRSPRRRHPGRLLEFALVLLAMLLLSERTWKHHATALPIVYLGIWYVLTCYPWSGRFRAWFVTGLVVQWMLLVGSGEFLFGDRIADLLLDGGVFCWGLVLCFLQTAVMLVALERKRRPQP